MTAKGYAVSAENPHLRSYPPNEVVIQEDTPNDGAIYILEKGTLGVFKGGEMLSELNSPGEIVGEMAPILGLQRTATIRTLTDCQITVYTGDLRERLIERLPPVTQKIVIAITKRLYTQTILHAEDRIRIHNLEKMNQQKRKQVADLTKQNEDKESTDSSHTQNEKVTK